ncbi:hypothetical protein HYS72_00745 [Candidatus Pacearchaeota archaeon]|nr:hypothetical protein [Candidatus Pacearchaeota archaeon]
MKTIIGVANEVLKWLEISYQFKENLENKTSNKNNSDFKENLENKTSNKNNSDFIYVPSINLYFSRERKFLGEDWFISHKKLQENGERMPTIPEFIELLKYSKENDRKLYRNITEFGGYSDKGEWLDANFKKRDDGLYILTENENKEERLEECLMQDKTPGISLDDFVKGKNITSQGLPNKNVSSGILHYRYPGNNNRSVAWFCVGYSEASFNCKWNPSITYSYLGVRAVRRE